MLKRRNPGKEGQVLVCVCFSSCLSVYLLFLPLNYHSGHVITRCCSSRKGRLRRSGLLPGGEREESQPLSALGPRRWCAGQGLLTVPAAERREWRGEDTHSAPTECARFGVSILFLQQRPPGSEGSALQLLVSGPGSSEFGLEVQVFYSRPCPNTTTHLHGWAFLHLRILPVPSRPWGWGKARMPWPSLARVAATHRTSFGAQPLSFPAGLAHGKMAAPRWRS